MNNEIKITQSFTHSELLELFDRMTKIVREGTDEKSALYFALYDMNKQL